MKLLLLSLLCLINIPAAQATCIAYDGSSMAADSQITAGDMKILNQPGYKKLVRIGGHIVGCAGSVADGRKFKRWFAHQTDPKPTMSNMTALVFGEDGCFTYDEDCNPTEVSAPYAIGSGSDIALGAMISGASAKAAVEAAAQVDLHTGGNVQVMELETATPPPAAGTP